MSVVAVYEVEPRPGVPIGANGDVSELQSATGAGVATTHDIDLYIGDWFDDTFDLPKQGFFRFEVAKPKDATIVGVRFEATSATLAGSNGPIPMYGGFLKRQGGDTAWEGSLGVNHWAIDFQVPLVDYESLVGHIHDETVFWGDASGYAETNHATAVSSALWSIGDGTFTGTAANAPGLVAQLQSYLDDDANEATRGSTKAGSVPVMFTVLRNSVGTRNQYQFIVASDSIVVEWRPRLRVEYTIPFKADRHVIGTPRLRSAVAGLAHLEGAVSGVASARAAVAGRPSVSSAVTGSASVRDAVAGRGRIR